MTHSRVTRGIEGNGSPSDGKSDAFKRNPDSHLAPVTEHPAVLTSIVVRIHDSPPSLVHQRRPYTQIMLVRIQPSPPIMGKWPNGIGTCIRNKQSLQVPSLGRDSNFLAGLQRIGSSPLFHRDTKTVPAHHLSPVTETSDVLTSFRFDSEIRRQKQSISGSLHAIAQR